MVRNLYLALGDSITAGHGATHPGLGFVRYVSDYAKAKSLTRGTIAIARNGWTTRDIWQSVHLVHSSIWERAHILTLMTGGNDFRSLLRRLYLPIGEQPLSLQLVDSKLLESKHFMSLIYDSIANRHIPHVIVATVYNPAPNFSLAVYAMESLNESIRTLAKQYHFQVVDIYGAFCEHEAQYIEGYRSGRLEDLATPFKRPIHPNNAGHRQIADLITRTLNVRIKSCTGPTNSR